LVQILKIIKFQTIIVSSFFQFSSLAEYRWKQEYQDMTDGLDQKPTPDGHTEQYRHLSTEHLRTRYIYIKKFIDDENNDCRDDKKGKSHGDIV